MQLDWTTFVLEVINFLVLVWLLQRFFYRPVLAVLDKRQTKVQTIKAEAEAIRRDAEALKTQYESRLAAWNTERETARQKLEQELSAERTARLDDLKRLLADEEARNRARSDAAAAAHEAQQNRQAVADAYSAAAAMLKRLASSALTARIAQVFREDLDSLSEIDRTMLMQAVAALSGHEVVEISSAHPIEEMERTALAEALAKTVGKQLKINIRLAPELIGGIRVAVGQCRLDVNLADELVFFQRQIKHA